MWLFSIIFLAIDFKSFFDSEIVLFSSATPLSNHKSNFVLYFSCKFCRQTCVRNVGIMFAGLSSRDNQTTDNSSSLLFLRISTLDSVMLNRFLSMYLFGTTNILHSFVKSIFSNPHLDKHHFLIDSMFSSSHLPCLSSMLKMVKFLVV